MATRTWINGKQTQLDNGTAWVGGTAPGAGDTGVISSAGDGAPSQDSTSSLLIPAAASSEAYLATVFETDGAVYTDEAGGRILVTADTPQAAAVATGETLAGTLDLLGAGSATELALQDSTLAASGDVNVSGLAFLYAAYSNTLAGTISIGSPISVDGIPVPSAPADARGLTSELDINVKDYGSWNDAGSLSGYVPQTVNTGLIDIRANSGLFAFMDGTTAFADSLGNEDFYTAPAVSAFVNQGIILVQAGGTMSAETTDNSGSIINNGLISVDGGAGFATDATFGAVYGGTGLLDVNGGSQTDASMTEIVFDGNMVGGSIDVANATLAFEVGFKPDMNSFSGGTVDFKDAHGHLGIIVNDQLIIGSVASSFTDTIDGFQAGDTLSVEVTNDSFEENITSSVMWDAAQHKLDVYENADLFGSPVGQTLIASFALAGTYGASSFAVSGPVSSASGDANTVTITTTQPGTPPCFLAGTRILTQRGEVPVESLREGDRVVTLSGNGATLKPIVWIGRSPWDAARHPQPEQVWPVRIRAGALGPATPHRDLLVSPGHSLAIDGVLLQAERLVNGATIVRERSIARGVYYHVELEAHDILLSEGVPSESYVDVGNRHAFANGPGPVALHPDFSPSPAGATCLELVEHGPRLAAARTRLLARALEVGHSFEEASGLHAIAGDRTMVAERLEERTYRFELPAGTGLVRLVSRNWVPAEMEVDSDDVRMLGVCVSLIVVDDRRRLALGDKSLTTGWHAVEHGPDGPFRWTDGVAEIRAKARRLTVTLCGAERYWKRHPVEAQMRKTA